MTNPTKPDSTLDVVKTILKGEFEFALGHEGMAHKKAFDEARHHHEVLASGKELVKASVATAKNLFEINVNPIGASQAIVQQDKGR